MNQALDRLYAQLLRAGFLVLRQAADSANTRWVAAEIELLHNVPSLIDEPNVERHRYFWEHERRSYLEWLEAEGDAAAVSRMRTYYEPLWAEMAPLLTRLFTAPVAHSAGRS